jgi:carbohydrate binding protein with CBM35 domain/glycosyl hydrolase family 20
MKNNNISINRTATLDDSSKTSEQSATGLLDHQTRSKRSGFFAPSAKLLAVVMVFLLASTATFAKEIKIDSKQQQNIVRHLFPLPQKVELKGKVFAFGPHEFMLELDGKLSKRSKEFINEFKKSWTKRYKTKLAVGSTGEKVTIYIGTTKSFKPFKLAEKQQLLDLKKLKNVKNAEQGYAISCTAAGDKVNIYIAANKAPGIYNALTTFEQLLAIDSTPQKVVIPQINIMDWPDIKSRGEWGSKLYRTPKRLVKYSKMKLNTYWDPHLYGGVSKAGKIYYTSKKELIDKGASLNIHIIPILTHLDVMLNPGYMVGDNFREIAGIEGNEKFKNHHPWCFSNPKSQQVLDGIFEAIARDVDSDYLWMWPSEHGHACSCPKCKGDKKMQNIREFKHIMHAYKKAKVIRPNLKMTLITTQGTRKYNLELLKYLPKDVGLDIYDGNLTYQTMIDVPILDSFEPLMKQMRAEGRSIGVVPIFASSHWPAVMFFPFNSPLLSKVRMQEFKAKGIERVIGFLPPNIFAQNICGQSMAEFAWNVDGRTPKEFLISLAVRQRIKNPELFAEVLLLVEPSELMLSKSIRASQLRHGVARMVNILMGNKPKWQNYHSIRRGFKKNGKSQLPVALAACNKAYKLAKQHGNKELITGTLLIKQWINIIELYNQYIEDRSKGDKTGRQIKALFEALPETWEAWIVTKHLSPKKLKERRDAFYKTIETAMKIINAGKAKDADKVKKTNLTTLPAKVTIKAGDKIFEAETAISMNGVEVKNNGDNHSGSGFVDYIDAEGAFIEWEVKIDKPGKYNISFVYALFVGNRPLSLSVNGTIVKQKLAFPATGNWSKWTETTVVQVTLKSGVNKIKITATGLSGPNIDYLKLSKQ